MPRAALLRACFVAVACGALPASATDPFEIPLYGVVMGAERCSRAAARGDSPTRSEEQQWTVKSIIGKAF